MNQIETLLTTLKDSPRGLTAQDLRQRTDIPQNVLATYLWGLKRDGYITRVGGVRGSWRYGLTEKGLDRIGEGPDPLNKLAQALTGQPRMEGPLASFDETLRLIQRVDEYRLLRRFVEWLVSESPDLLACPEAALPALHRKVLEYLGVDPSAYRQQSRALVGLLELLKENT